MLFYLVTVGWLLTSANYVRIQSNRSNRKKQPSERIRSARKDIPVHALASQFNELGVDALDLLQHFILGEYLLQREVVLVEDVIDRTAAPGRRARDRTASDSVQAHVHEVEPREKYMKNKKRTKVKR